MAWITLDEDYARGAISAPELAAYQGAAIAIGQDPLADITATAVHEARAYIADCAKNQLAEGLTVPERIVHHILAIIRFRMLTRLDLEVSKERTKEYDTAQKFLVRVSECKVSIELPEGATEDNSSAENIELVESQDRNFTRTKQSGL